MQDIETDYLIVGAGASGMAFADTLLSETASEIVMLDRRSRPGGHWVDTYPFVQLHQPSAYYGVNSLPLGQNRIDKSGINAGFYERATAAEIIHYFQRVLEEVLIPTNRFKFFGGSEYLGAEDDRHIFRSNVSDKLTRVTVRRALVDGTLVASKIPARHKPSFNAQDGVSIVTPNTLVDIVNAKGFTILGAGKTAMDVCFWLLQQGVSADEICWVRPRDAWMVERSYTQPFSLAANMARMQAETIRAAAEASDPLDYSKRMEAAGIYVRLQPDQDAFVNRGATISLPELNALKEIRNVIAKGHVQSIGQKSIALDTGDVATNPGRIYVDCTAAGLSNAPAVTIFEAQKINLHFTTLGVAPWSASVIAMVESLEMNLIEKNRLCPPLPRNGDIYSVMNNMRVGMPAEMNRRKVSELADWMAKARLNPGGSIQQRLDDPQIQAAFEVMAKFYQQATINMEKMCNEDRKNRH